MIDCMATRNRDKRDPMPDQPNIIYILSDEHFGGSMSHMGDPNVRTPYLDGLAEGGVSFRRAYANCPICTPSRGTIFSGRHAHAGPVQSFFDVYKATAPSTATLLREAGYHTAYFGKWHCGVVNNQEPPKVRENRDAYTRWPQRTPEYHRAGYQDWNGFEINNAPFEGFYYHQKETNPRRMDAYQTDALTDLAIDYLNRYGRSEPLHLVLSVEPPHFPLEAPASFERWEPDELKVKPNFEDSLDMRKELATYYAMVENLDWNVGRLLKEIRASGRFRENTLLVYFSDHGDYMGSHGAIKRKEHPHEESVRIPAIFNWSGHIPALGLVDGLFSLVDLLPTTLALAGVSIPDYAQGTDFSSLLLGDPFDGPDAVFLEMVGNPRWNLDFLDWRGLVTDRWKYAFYETGHELLFDLDEDPFEMRNLASVSGEIRDQMKTRLLALLEETRDPYFDILIRQGATLERPVCDVGRTSSLGRLAPTWIDGTVRSPDPSPES